MKKLFVFLFAGLFCVSALLTGCSENATHGNYSDEMKIPYGTDIDPEYGADSVERDGDHKDSPYFSRLDYYNMKSTDTLTILTGFKTYQQTCESSCGVASTLMVLNYFGKLGSYTEADLAKLRNEAGDYKLTGATSVAQVLSIFEHVGGFEVGSTYDYYGKTDINGEPYFDEDGSACEGIYSVITPDWIIENLKNDMPIMICWNDWGGHWQVIIGYDTMGTETTQDDVLIVADPYDTTDHNQDGYGTYGAERVYYNWTMYDFFEGITEMPERDFLFVTAKPVS